MLGATQEPRLYQVDLLHLLPALFRSAQSLSAVAAELAEGRIRGVRLPELVELSWMTVRPVRDRTLLPLVTSLGNGEKEVLALGLETPDHLLMLDDRNARQHAKAAGLEIVGTLGVLVHWCSRGSGALSIRFGRFWIASKSCNFESTPGLSRRFST